MIFVTIDFVYNYLYLKLNKLFLFYMIIEVHNYSCFEISQIIRAFAEIEEVLKNLESNLLKGD